MKHWRKWLVMLLLIALVGAHAYDVFAQKEHWPISPYPMYSKLQPNRIFRTNRLMGITAKGGKEVELRAGYLRAKLQVMRDEKIGGERARGVLKDIFDSIEKQRRAGADSTPQLKGVRLYHYRWRMTWRATNIDRPDEITLIGEYIKPVKENRATWPATQPATAPTPTRVKKKKIPATAGAP